MHTRFFSQETYTLVLLQNQTRPSSIMHLMLPEPAYPRRAHVIELSSALDRTADGGAAAVPLQEGRRGRIDPPDPKVIGVLIRCP